MSATTDKNVARCIGIGRRQPTKPHLVCQDGIDVLAVQERQPIEADHLVRLERAFAGQASGHNASALIGVDTAHMPSNAAYPLRHCGCSLSRMLRPRSSSLSAWSSPSCGRRGRRKVSSVRETDVGDGKELQHCGESLPAMRQTWPASFLR